MKLFHSMKKGLVIMLSIVIITVTGICNVYIRQLKDIAQNETNRYLTEYSNFIADMVDSRVGNVYQILESISDSYLRIQDDQKNNYLMDKVKKHHFLCLSVTDENGMGVSTNGTTVDFSDEKFWQRAINGESVIFDGLFSMNHYNSTQTVFYGVPIYQGQKITGVLVAENTKEEFRRFLQMDRFGGEGSCFVMDRQGNFIVKENMNTPYEKESNYFDLLEKYATIENGYSLETVKNKMMEGKEDFFYYTLKDGSKRAANFTPLKTEGWYVLSVIPTEVVSGKTEFAIQVTVLMNILIVLLFLVLIFMILAIQRKSRLLEKIAYFDPVTDGYSHTKFEIEAKKLISESPAGAYAMVSLDIDKFKLINDAFGSEAGNQTLKYIYSVIQSHLNEKEIAARSMADTFYILIREYDEGKIEARLEKMVEDINSFNERLERKYYLTIMKGVYIIKEPFLSFITIQDRANTARKSIKRGRASHQSSCIFYSDLERDKMIQEKEIENRMEEALKNREFVVYLQPKYELIHDSVSGAEALVRWQDPLKGLIPPNDFISVFEKNGFIIQLDLFVFEEVCKILKRWIDEKKDPVPISVNLSRIHLYHSDFLQQYKNIFQKYDIPPELIEIELTETVVFENMDMLIDVIREIHEFGFTCSLDDFGSGYSSLNMLKEIPVDTIKLDRQFFVRNQADNERGDYVVEAVIDLAKKLKMKSVSEGVERIPQVEFLKKAKCDMVQGYVFSKPVPIMEFEKLAFSEKTELEEPKGNL